ncbi:MAG: putative ABC transporter permease [Christensenellales bacterium]
MTREEKNELLTQLGSEDYEAYMELRRQMDVLAADERMDDAQKAAFYAEIRDELVLLRKRRDLMAKKLQAFNELIDEVETRLKETEQYDRRKKKKVRILPPAPTNAQIDYREKQEAHFAQGMTFYKLFWVFFIGCFAGVVLETIYCLIQRGHYESRVGLIYGPFNLVYGIGALCLSGALYQFRNRGRVFSFVGGFVVGSVVEYACSWFQEVCFGSTSWDYSNMPYNLNGRICLLYSIFWGILGIFWIKDIYPRMAKWILKIPNKVGKPLTWVLLVFMVFNSVMTLFTSLRWTARREGIEPRNAFEAYLDEHYPDERMQKIFANAEFTEDREARMQDEQESQNNFQKLEELSKELGQETTETIEDAIDTIKSDAEK